jgi:quinol monooxygenase YgiN
MSRSLRTSFNVIARMRGLPEKTDELRAHLRELARLTRTEHGCLSCEIIENGCDPTEFTLLEKWSQENQHYAHLDTDLIRRAMSFISDLLSAELDPSRHELRLNSVRYGTNSYCLSANRPVTLCDAR